MSTPYDRSHRLPFPMLMVYLATDEHRVGPLPALLDTGADFTLVPTPLLELIGAEDTGLTRVRTHFGDSHLHRAYGINVEVDGVTVLSVFAIGDDERNEVILGRDVLNKLPLFLDRPQRQTQLLDDATVKRLRARRSRP